MRWLHGRIKAIRWTAVCRTIWRRGQKTTRQVNRRETCLSLVVGHKAPDTEKHPAAQRQLPHLLQPRPAGKWTTHDCHAVLRDAGDVPTVPVASLLCIGLEGASSVVRSLRRPHGHIPVVKGEVIGMHDWVLRRRCSQQRPLARQRQEDAAVVEAPWRLQRPPQLGGRRQSRAASGAG